MSKIAAPFKRSSRIIVHLNEKQYVTYLLGQSIMLVVTSAKTLPMMLCPGLSAVYSFLDCVDLCALNTVCAAIITNSKLQLYDLMVF